MIQKNEVFSETGAFGMRRGLINPKKSFFNPRNVYSSVRAKCHLVRTRLSIQARLYSQSGMLRYAKSKALTNVFGYFMALGEQISHAPSLSAIRAAFFLILPFLFLNSLGILLMSFPLDGYRTFMADTLGLHWQSYISPFVSVTQIIISPLVAFGIGHYLATQFNHKNQKLHVSSDMVGFVAVAAFFSMVPSASIRPLEFWSGTPGLFTAIFISFPVVKVFLALFSCKSLRIHWPGSASGLVITQGFNAFVPAIMTVILCVVMSQAVTHFVGKDLYELLYSLSMMPFSTITTGLEQALFHVLSMQALWFMGFHGAHMLRDLAYGVYDTAMTSNVVASMNGVEIPHILTDTFLDAFVFMGGAGTGLALVGALLFFGKTPANRKLAFFCLIPCIFNINEVLLFGAPIILNPILLIPFLVTPIVMTLTSYASMAVGLVPKTTVLVEWTTPIFMNGYLATESMSAVVLQCANLLIGMAIYTPFVLFGNRMKEKQFTSLFDTLLQRATATITDSRQYINYNDDAGALARSLVVEMEHSLKTGEGFYLMLQPQVCARTGKVVSAESLVRWRTKAYGNIATPITIALAEASGLIQPLGLWIFNEACRLRKQWMDEGFDDIVLSVNVSGAQLEDSFAEQLQYIMAMHDLPLGSVEIEVTESRMLGSSIDESKALMDLHSSGFPLAIDDFGMGHSSLKYLRKFPVSVVKIDGAIVKDVLTNPICADIISTITKLCRARSMRCIAEFVETEKHAEKLRELDCDLFQGYLYSAPLLPDACLEYIHNINDNLEKSKLAACEQDS